MTHECYNVGITYGSTLYVDGEEYACLPPFAGLPPVFVGGLEVCGVCTPSLGLHDLVAELPGFVSEPLTIDRVPAFDTGNGIIDWVDWLFFSFSYGKCVAPNGVLADCRGGE